MKTQTENNKAREVFDSYYADMIGNGKHDKQSFKASIRQSLELCKEMSSRLKMMLDEKAHFNNWVNERIDYWSNVVNKLNDLEYSVISKVKTPYKVK